MSEEMKFDKLQMERTEYDDTLLKKAISDLLGSRPILLFSGLNDDDKETILYDLRNDHDVIGLVKRIYNTNTSFAAAEEAKDEFLDLIAKKADDLTSRRYGEIVDKVDLDKLQ